MVSNCYLPTIYPILFKVKAAYFLFAYILSERPSAKAVTNSLVNIFRSFSFNIGNKTAVSCMKTFINCLFGSLIRIFRLFIKSCVQLIVTLLKLSLTKAIIASALYFLFCQLELSFILGKSSRIFCVMSTFGLPSSKFTVVFWAFFASPLN